MAPAGSALAISGSSPDPSSGDGPVGPVAAGSFDVDFGAGDVDSDESLESEEDDEGVDVVSSAQAAPGAPTITPPMPRATANAPTRPMCAAYGAGPVMGRNNPRLQFAENIINPPVVFRTCRRWRRFPGHNIAPNYLLKQEFEAFAGQVG
ncbi:hypothetical protein GCM10010409_06270 [Mycolicibacterium diernhoferi]